MTTGFGAAGGAGLLETPSPVAFGRGTSTDTPKIIFADQLRGVAALSVVLSHLGGVFILMDHFVGQVISAPEVQVGQPAILSLTRVTWLNYGAFGVAVFFLISGFVIPFSLRRQGARAFLVARAFRIYPTLWAALMLEWLVVRGQSHLYGLPMASGWKTYLSNMLLTQTVIGGSVDLVNWTLAVEVKFYLLMALLRRGILAGRVWPLVAWSLLAIGAALARQHGWVHVSVALADEPMCIGFMLIGTVFHYHMTGRLAALPALGAGLLLAGLFALCWRIGPIQEQFPVIIVNYFYALALFSLAYAARGAFRRVRWLDGLAAVSYPLYLIHSIIGYSAMTFCIVRLGFSYAEALPAALAVVLLLAWLLHRLVEQPSLALGKRLAAGMRSY